MVQIVKRLKLGGIVMVFSVIFLKITGKIFGGNDIFCIFATWEI